MLSRIASEADNDAQRLAIVRNPKSSQDMIRTVVSQPLSSASKVSLAKDTRTPGLALDAVSTDPATHKELARNSSASAAALLNVAKGSDVNAQFLAGFHPNANAAVGDALAASPKWEVRYAPAKTQKASPATIAKLKKDSNSWVKDLSLIHISEPTRPY